ncbi:LysR family transcriptional regulator [Gordonia shandongensis]|uniref:LysR family transcriptional regulator n=1 Tax=Gordonia shandongensis TaxID=376351 RepID=UPI00041ED408|nr:LysR family transcriptional regulator [Gordonia shandongensis]
MQSRRGPSLDHLRTFLTVYRAESFRDAARRLRVSQPTVTNHIASVEAWFGSELFDRRVNGAVPSSTAHELYASLAEHLDYIDRLVTGSPDGGAVRTVSIGGPREFIAHRLLPALRADRDNLPKLNFSLGESQALLADLESGVLDFVVSTVRPKSPEIKAWPIADEEFWLVAAPEVPLRGRTLSELATVPMVAYNGDLAIIRRFWNIVFGADPNFDPAVVLPDLLLVKHAVLNGYGMTVLPSYLVADEVASGTLVRWDEVADPPLNTVFLAVRRAALDVRKQLSAVADLIIVRVKEDHP